MINQTVARRYARALLDLAREEKTIEPVAAHLREMAELISASADLSKILYGGLFTIADRKAIVEKLAAKQKSGKSFLHFLYLLIDHDRMRFLPVIAALYQGQADDLAGRARARVVSAVDLDKKTQQEIAGRLGKFTGRQVECSFGTDAALLGGVRAEIGGTVLDGTLKAQLDRLTHTLQQG